MDAERQSPGAPASTSRTPGDVLIIAALGTIYFLSGRLGLQLAFLHKSASPVWPPTGIALAAVLILGYRIWPGIWLSAFLVNLTTAGSVAATAGIATGNTLEAVVGAWLVTRLANGRKAFNRAPDVFKYILLAAVFSTALSATFGVTSLALAGLAAWEQFGPIWVTWWLGDMVSAIVIAPLLVIWSSAPLPRWSLRRKIEGCAMLLSIIATGVLVFGDVFPAPLKTRPLSFLTIPVLVWGAFRFGQWGAVTSAFLTSGIAIWGTMRGGDPTFLSDPNRALLILQMFMGTATVTSLVLGAVVTERERVEGALRQSRRELRNQFDELENLYHTAPVGLCLMDTQFRFVRINERLAEINGLSRSEHLGRTIRDVLPELADTLEPIFRRVIATGEPSVDHEIVGSTPAEPGVERTWLASYHPVRGTRGPVHGISVVVQDITGLKRPSVAPKAQRWEEPRPVESESFSVEMGDLGIAASLQELAHAANKSFGVRCLIDVEGGPFAERRDEVASELFRIAREAVYNAVKHAEATHVFVRLGTVEGETALTVEDDGIGPPVEVDDPRGAGMRIMQYRARMMGGRLDARRGPSGGLVVSCSVPDA